MDAHSTNGHGDKDRVFHEFTRQLGVIISKDGGRVEHFFPELEPVFKDIMSHREFLSAFFVRLATDDEFLSQQLVVMEPNEFVLYYDAAKAFSIRFYIWDDFVYSYIHDHGSWGVYAALVNSLRVINYRRLDDGSDMGYAELEMDRHFTLDPGGISYVKPYNEGIHMIGSSSGIAITMNIYGTTRRRGYINRYDVEKKRVTRIYTPRLEKRLLAVRALGDIGHEVAIDTLVRTARDDYPMVRWESIASTEKLDADLHIKLLKDALEDQSRRLRARARRELERKGF